MKLTTQGVGIRIGERLEEKIESKFNKFNRYFGEDFQVHVKVHPEKDLKRVELTFRVKSHIYRAEAKDEDILTAIDKTVDKLESQIHKQKTKFEKRIHDYAYMKDYLKDIAARSTEEESESKIIRSKTFPLVPMSADEATLQMEMLGHNFLLFLNADNGDVNLVYKRNDGDYGLLIPSH